DHPLPFGFGFLLAAAVAEAAVEVGLELVEPVLGAGPASFSERDEGHGASEGGVVAAVGFGHAPGPFAVGGFHRVVSGGFLVAVPVERRPAGAVLAYVVDPGLGDDGEVGGSGDGAVGDGGAVGFDPPVGAPFGVDAGGDYGVPVGVLDDLDAGDVGVVGVYQFAGEHAWFGQAEPSYAGASFPAG